MSMYAEERQQAMAQLVSERGRLSVAVIADQFDVTTETVRRDLSALERMGLVRRVHGGAVPASVLAVIESGIGERDLANTDAKDRIAQAAVEHLPAAGGTALFDAGSTTSRLASMLPRDLRLTVDHPRRPDRVPAGRQPAGRAAPAAGAGAPHHAGGRRRRDGEPPSAGSGPTSPSSAPTA